MTTGRGLVYNAAGVLVTQVTPPALNAAFIVVLARTLGAETLGGYAVLVTAFMVLDQTRMLGLQRFVTRELAAQTPSPTELYRGLRGVGAAGGLVAAPLLLWYVHANGLVPIAAGIAFCLAFIPSNAVAANEVLFLAVGRADLNARVAVAESAVRALVSTWVVWTRGPDLVMLGAVYAGSRAIAAGLGKRYRRDVGWSDVGGADWSATRRLWRHTPAFFTVSALPLLILRGDLLLIGSIGSAVEVGMYSAASRLVSVILLLPDSLMIANFVRLAKSARQPLQFRRQFGRVIGATLAGVVPVTVVVTVFAPWCVTAIYGANFAPAIPFMRWLIWSVPLFAASRAIGDALIALGHQSRIALVIIATAASSMLFYPLCIARWGGVGVAAAYVATIAALLAYTVIAAAPFWTHASPRAYLATRGAVSPAE